ncbi:MULTISPECIES: TM2 domain-containing protein [Clostridium]|uniref:TM2 domain-containing protein n=1 Tax=Clostridium senegalense TaxID=1465809 RepID=A0A6M0H628_9CLOT|nr:MULTISPECIES: TM2 domain-containing protein [Clostridium]NEU05987.1 TM2 domain-containing protein [Clostridium senegalense]
MITAQELKVLDEKQLKIYEYLVEKERVKLPLVYILWVLGGMLGFHNAYLGRKDVAKSQLITTIVSAVACLIIIGLLGLLVVLIWIIVDLFSINKYVEEANNEIERRIYNEIINN